VTNVTFSFETSPNLREKCGGHDMLCSPRLKKWRGHVPRVPHQIAPMLLRVLDSPTGVPTPQLNC